MAGSLREPALISICCVLFQQVKDLLSFDSHQIRTTSLGVFRFET